MKVVWDTSDYLFLIASLAIFLFFGLLCGLFVRDFLIPFGMYVILHFAFFLDFSIPQKQT